MHQGIIRFCSMAIALLLSILFLPLSVLAVSGDPLYGNQWGVDLVMKNPAGPERVWDIPNADGSGITIYVIDSGVSPHGDLSFADAGGDSDPAAIGHGTGVYGILAANHNGIGIAGMVPGANVVSRKTPIAFNNTVTALNNLIAEATPPNYVVQLSRSYPPSPININNMCPVVNNVINNGGFIVSSTGNILGINPGVQVPAACNDSGLVTVANRQRILSVGNSQVGDVHNPSSSYSPDHDLFAPGTNIHSTTKAGGYTDFTGTSFAAPIVSGAAAILMGCGVSPANIETVLEASGPAIAFPGGNAPRINVYTALANENNAPSGLSLQNAMAMDIVPPTQTLTGGPAPIAATTIGQVVAIDSDSCDSHSYQILPGGDPRLSLADSDADGLVDDIVLAAGVYNIAETLTVTVRTTDFFGVANAAVNDLTITVNIDVPVPAAPILDVALVMDRSGSMGWASASVGSRMDVLKNAANAFVDYLNLLTDSVRLGFVQFNAGADAIPPAPAAELFPFQEIIDDPDAMVANIDEAHDAINLLAPLGGTNIVEGVQDGAAVLDVSDPSARQAMLLFTDGLHNVPAPLDESSVPTTLSSALSTAINAVNPAMAFFSMGLGTEASINTASLNATAMANDGRHVNELDPVLAMKAFTDFANEIVTGSTIMDPILVLKPNELGQLDIPVTYADNSVRFAIFWSYADASQVVTRINTPSGSCVISDEDRGAQFIQAKGKKYRIVNVDLPFICNGQLEHGGLWSVEMLARGGRTSGTGLSHVAATATPFEQERFAVSAYSTSDVILQVDGEPTHQSIQFVADLDGIDAAALENVRYTAFVMSPLTGEKLSTADDLNVQQQAEQRDIQRALLANREPQRIDMKVGQANQAKASLSVRDTGIYQVRVVLEATDKAGFVYRREANTSIYYERKPYSTWHIVIVCILLLLLLLVLWMIIKARRAKTFY